jgi:hypothetical protein
MNGADWSDRYPLIAAEAARLKGSAILDAEVVCPDKDGESDFGLLHSRCFDHVAVAKWTMGLTFVCRDFFLQEHLLLLERLNNNENSHTLGRGLHRRTQAINFRFRG